jgi:hypothetical protein
MSHPKKVMIKEGTRMEILEIERAAEKGREVVRGDEIEVEIEIGMRKVVIDEKRGTMMRVTEGKIEIEAGQEMIAEIETEALVDETKIGEKIEATIGTETRIETEGGTVIKEETGELTVENDLPRNHPRTERETIVERMETGNCPSLPPPILPIVITVVDRKAAVTTL